MYVCGGSLVKENRGLLLFEFVRYQVEEFEKVSINLCIFLGGILSYVSFCMVVVWMEPRMPAIIIIVGKTIHPCWVVVVFRVSYFSNFLLVAWGNLSLQ